jgi:hypothetical protein
MSSNVIFYVFLQLSIIVDSLCQLWIVIKNNMRYRMTENGYAAFVHTIWYVQDLYLPKLTLIWYAVWEDLLFRVQCLLLGFRMFQAFAAGIIRW